MNLPHVDRLAAAQQKASTSEILIPDQAPWPELAEEAFHGVAGRYVRKIDPHTEADPAGILAQFLVMAGSVIGRGPHFRVEADEHHFNLFAVLVGESSKGRKGVSSGQAKRLFQNVDPDWCDNAIQHGLSSGEGLIWAVRDPIVKAETGRGQDDCDDDRQVTVLDAGVTDKRLLVLEAEFASTLRMLERSGNTLSATLRDAWDQGDLRILTKNSPAQATGAHISMIGHITRAELLRYLNSTEAANGFGNRFLWCAVRRSKVLPEGGAAHTVDFGPEILDLRKGIDLARRTREVRRDDEAREIWAQVYPELSEGKPGLLGSMIGRAEAQTMRLACLFALLGGSSLVRAEHLLAALALWTYCEESARWIFGDALGDPVADEIVNALRRNSNGLTRTEINRLFGGHRQRQAIEQGLLLLLKQGLVSVQKEGTEGRPIERWKAAGAGRDDS